MEYQAQARVLLSSSRKVKKAQLELLLLLSLTNGSYEQCASTDHGCLPDERSFRGRFDSQGQWHPELCLQS